MRPIAIEITDGRADSTRFEFIYEQDEKNQRIPNMLSLAFPFRSRDTFSVFMKIRSSNPFLLCMAFEQLMMGINMMGQSGEFVEEIWEHLLSKTAIKMAPLHDSCLLLIDLGPTEMGKYLEETLDEAFKIITKIKPNIFAEFSVAKDIKDMLNLVILAHKDQTRQWRS